MPELSDLQAKVLSILKEHADKSMFGPAMCNLTNDQIYNLIMPASARPTEAKYLSSVLKRLAIKNQIKIDSRFVVGNHGKKRVITIL